MQESERVGRGMGKWGKGKREERGERGREERNDTRPGGGQRRGRREGGEKEWEKKEEGNKLANTIVMQRYIQSTTLMCYISIMHVCTLKINIVNCGFKFLEFLQSWLHSIVHLHT